jgi:hypothetical protein
VEFVFVKLRHVWSPCEITSESLAWGRSTVIRRASAIADFPDAGFNVRTIEARCDALGYYRERQDEKRNIGLGPDHDLSSHAADAFGYMAVAYDEPPVKSMTKAGVPEG